MLLCIKLLLLGLLFEQSLGNIEEASKKKKYFFLVKNKRKIHPQNFMHDSPAAAAALPVQSEIFFLLRFLVHCEQAEKLKNKFFLARKILWFFFAKKREERKKFLCGFRWKNYSGMKKWNPIIISQ